MESLVAVIGCVMVFSIPLSAIWTQHRRKVLEMEMQLRNQGDANLRATVESLREEVRALRDTTTQYDLSFDTALQRMEQRVNHIEQRANQTNESNVAELRSVR